MSQEQLLILMFKIVLVAGEAASLLWVAVYTYLAKWWDTPVGATVVRLAIYLAALLIPSILSLFLRLSRNTSLIAGWFDVAIFGIVAVELFRRVPLWVRLNTDESGHRSYAGMLPFLTEVIRRRGRPVWKDSPVPGEGEHPR